MVSMEASRVSNVSKVAVGFYEVEAGLYEMAVGILWKIRHSQNYDNHTLSVNCLCLTWKDW